MHYTNYIYWTKLCENVTCILLISEYLIVSNVWRKEKQIASVFISKYFKVFGPINKMKSHKIGFGLG